MTYEKIRVEPGRIFCITLADPDRRNALSGLMISELLRAIDDAHAGDARVILLAAEGRVFCAGANLADAGGGKGLDDFPRLLSRIFDTEVPIVAAVAGHALGGGMGIATAATFVVASDKAELGTPEINVGLFPMMIMAALARVIPRKKLLEMMLLGDRISAVRAQELGIVSQVVAGEAVESTARALAERLAEKSPAAIRRGLRAFAKQDGVRLEESLPFLKEALVDCLSTDDAREGLMAFVEKRVPVFTGK